MPFLATDGGRCSHPGVHRFAEATIRLVATYRWAVIALLVAGVAGTVWAWGNATGWDPNKQPVDNGVEIWFLEDDPALARFRRFHEDFGNDEVILVGFHDAGGLFTPANLTMIADVSSRLKAIVEIENVTSLATVVHTGIRADDPDEEIVVSNLYRGAVTSEAQAKEIEGKLLGSPFLRDQLLSIDAKTTLITARLELLDDIDTRRGVILAQVERELKAAWTQAGRPERDWAWAGLAVANEAMNQISQEDMGTYTNLSLIVIAFCLWFSLKRVIPVVIAMTAVILAVVLLVGVYLGTGNKLNLVTIILPSLVMVIGLTDSVYFLTTYYQDRELYESQGLSKREAIVKSLGFCFLPGLFNSITASVGFLAFASAKMAVIRQFGIFAGIGIVIAFLMSVLVCTVGVDLFDVRPRRSEDSAGGAWTRAFLDWLSAFVERRHKAIVACALGVAFVASLGILNLNVDSDPLNYFYPDHPVQVDAAFIEDHFGPAGPLEFVVDTGVVDGVKEPAVLRSLASLEANVTRTEPRVGGSVSLVGVVEQINELVLDAKEIPESLAAVDQELTLFYDPDSSDDPLRLVDFPDYQKARVTFRVSKMTMAVVAALIDRVEGQAKGKLPEGSTLKASGYVPLYVVLIDYLIHGQISSLLTTFLVVFAIIGILFRSLRYALISIPPNLIPVAMTLGFMGYAGINLDGATVLIASISLGVAVDDTIHFIFKFREVYEETGDDVLAVRKTLKTTGVAIATTSLIIALGFAVIALGNLKSMAYFGILTAVTMLSALVGELFVTPAVILTFAPRRAPSKADTPES